MNPKYVIAMCAVFALTGAVAAELPGIDAPTGAGIGSEAQRAPGEHANSPRVPPRETPPPQIGSGHGPDARGPAVGGDDRLSAEGALRGRGPINGGGVGAADSPAAGGTLEGPRELRDPIELCRKLAGIEREICERQAAQSRERAIAPVPQMIPTR